jgi:hypothetical protein
MKYTAEQLSAMAQSCQWYKTNNAEAYLGFILTLSMHTGLHPNAVEAEINKLAVA